MTKRLIGPRAWPSELNSNVGQTCTWYYIEMFNINLNLIEIDKAMYKVWLNAQEIYFAMFTGN